MVKFDEYCSSHIKKGSHKISSQSESVWGRYDLNKVLQTMTKWFSQKVSWTANDMSYLTHLEVLKNHQIWDGISSHIKEENCKILSQSNFERRSYTQRKRVRRKGNWCSPCRLLLAGSFSPFFPLLSPVQAPPNHSSTSRNCSPHLETSLTL